MRHEERSARGGRAIVHPGQVGPLFGMPPAQARFLRRFCLFTLLLFAALYLATDAETASLTHVVALLVQSVLRGLGIRTRLEGATIHVPGFTVSVVDQCTAVYESALLAAAMLAFPATGRERAAGIAVGTFALAALNVLRIATLLLVGAWLPDWFSAVHLYAWQAILAAAVVALWLGWISRVGAHA
jgi:archaeosortase B (VPXXXP-CTERM-specific)